MNRDVGEVQQQMYHLQQQVSNIETNARETANTLTQHFNDQIQQIYNELTADISPIKQEKQPLLPRPQTAPNQPSPGRSRIHNTTTKPSTNIHSTTCTDCTVHCTQCTAHTSHTTQKDTATATTTTYSEASQTSQPTYTTQGRKQNMSSKPATKQVKHQRTSGIAFIADSTMTFLTEDKDYTHIS